MSQLPKIRAVAFDLDGLMFNTEDVFTLTGTELLRRRDRLATPELFNAMMGRRSHEAFQVMIDLMELTDNLTDLSKESGEIFDSLLKDHLAPMPGLFELLEFIEEQNLPKAIATSSDLPYVTRILSGFDLRKRFHDLLTAEDVTNGKPDPEIYLKAAERLKVHPSEMLVLEDSENGTRAAAAAGAYVISVPHEKSRHHNFSMASAIAETLRDPIIKDLLSR